MIGDAHLGRCLVTGGTGTFGQAFRDRVLAEGLVDELVILSRDERKQAEQRERCPDPRVRWFLGDVRDRERLRRAFRGCDVVVHAAALKRVDACAYDPGEAVATNVEGTRHAVAAALDADVGRLLLLSTDKACEPANLYGATKLVAEHLVCAANAGVGRGRTRLGATRYGNVFGSRGSVLERWTRQAKAGEPLTLTDRAATRFWMTKAQAVSFVLEALAALRGGPRCPGGEVHVPVLPSVRMADVAAAVVQQVRPPHAPQCGTVVRGCWSTCPASEWDDAHEVEENGDESPWWDEQVGVTKLTPGEKRHEALVGTAEVRRAWLASPTRIVLSEATPPRAEPWGREGGLRSDDAAALVTATETARLVREALGA